MTTRWSIEWAAISSSLSFGVRIRFGACSGLRTLTGWGSKVTATEGA
jgi:hypothetical protein